MEIRFRGILATLAVLAAGTISAETALADSIEADITRTKYGVPHIKADNVKSLSAGYAYAFAEDNLCTIASEYVTVNAKRSKFFGPDETWTFSGNGSTYRNVDADIYFQWVKKRKIVEKLIKKKPPLGPKPGVRRGVAGYVKGYNAYLKKTGVGNLPDERCAGENWVRPIRRIDVYRRFFQLGILASSGAAISGIATAEPSGPGAVARLEAQRDEMLDDGSALERLQPDIGSNAYGFGKEATENGRGLVYGNPHFPWDGSERLYQTHLTIPGEIDVAGASLYGVPLVLIGHTRGLAWSHTVATAWRFTPFRLQLGSTPYTYVVDGEEKDMRKTDVTIKALADGGGTEEVTRSIYSTRVRADADGPGRDPPALDLWIGVRAQGRERNQLPLPQPLPRQQPRPNGSPVRPYPAALSGHPLGQLDRSRQDGRGLLLDARRDSLRRRRKVGRVRRRFRGVRDARAADPRRLALGVRLGFVR